MPPISALQTIPELAAWVSTILTLVVIVVLVVLSAYLVIEYDKRHRERDSGN